MLTISFIYGKIKSCSVNLKRGMIVTAGENNAAGIQRLVGLRLLTELSLSVVHVALVPQTSEERDWPAAVKCTKHCSSLGQNPPQ